MNKELRLALLCSAAMMVASTVQAETRWTGIAINAGIGAGAMVNDLQVAPGPYLDPDLFRAGFDGIGGEGVFGTVGVSVDYQIQRRFVVGAFFDYDFSSLESSLNLSVPGFGDLGVHGDFKLRNQWTIGGRIGILPTPDTLVYVLAGYTQADFSDPRLSITGPYTGTISAGLPSFSGWTAGLGMETMLTSNLSLKAEYRYTRLDSEKLDLPVIGYVDPNDYVDARVEPSIHTGRVVLSYKFNMDRGPAPVEPLK